MCVQTQKELWKACSRTIPLGALRCKEPTLRPESVMPSSHLILAVPFSSSPKLLPALGSFPMSQLFT